jgi:hypothetical protein
MVRTDSCSSGPQAGIEPAIRGYLIGNGKPDFKQLGKRAAIGRPPEAVLAILK